ncbi:MAG: SdrD B-like domain-containing protein, partial [Pirellulales bacterium]
PGTYAVAEVPQDGWEMISPATGTQDLTVGFGENVIGVNFANVRPRIGGIKYHDLNGNGTQQAGEPNLEGWTVFIDSNDNGLLDPLEPTSVTDQFGRYEFVGLATGTYIIREIQQSSWIQTAPSEGFYVVDYEADSVAVGRDFGNQRLGGLRGVKFHDVNENGLRDANEPGLGGWTIFLDLNNNGLRDGNEPFDVTNSNGSYVITDVAPITYTVAEVPQTNWEQTFPGGDGTQTVNLFGGITAANINFGNKGFASIEGVKFNDLDADGVRDPGEPGLPNFYIYLDANNNNHPGVGERGAFTDEDGNYKIARVEPGNYQLREVVSTRWRQTAPASGEYTANLRAGDELKGFDFGNVGLVDWGDAPIIYPVRSFEAGANHGIVAGFHLGPGAATVTKVDGDPNGQPSATAIGDDTNGLDDDDGVFGLDTPLVASTTKEITVIGSAAQDTLKGKLQGWVDFNWDGDWDDPGEQIVTDLIIARGPNTITFAVPADAKGGPTFARFRISYEFGLSPRGPTAAGEVEDYLVNINSTTTPFGTGATPLGTITDNTFDSLSITSPGELFSMTASQTGIFTAIAGFANREGNIDMAVFDAAGNPLGDSSSTRNQERIDFDSTAGETYYLRLYGENSGDVDLELFNLLAMNSPLTIMGTPGDDVVTVNAPDSSLGTTCSDCVEVTVNGTPYLFDARVKVTYEGNGGFDRLIVNSNDYNDQIRFYADATEVLNPTFQFDTMGVEDVRIDGGGGADRAWYHDMPGDETLRITQEFALRTQGNYRQQATNVPTVIAYSNDTDKDTALIYDSPGNDNLIARPDSVRLEGNGFFFYVVDYRNVLTYATAGGTNDKAYIYDGAGDEQLIVNPDLARMFGDDFYNYIRGFDRIYAYATGGGSNDTASLHGSSGDDTLVARPNSVVMSGSGFYYYTRNFERVYSYAKAGENDRAYMFDSSGNDVLMSRPAYTVLSGTTFYNYANGFDRVYAYATAGGTADYAYFYDSIGNDRFVARPDIARMEGSGFYNVASSFDKVQAYATAGGTDDRADVYDGSGNDLLFGRDDYFYFMGGNFDNRGVGFDSVYGYSVGGGLNTLDVLDNLYAFTPLGTWL